MFVVFYNNKTDLHSNIVLLKAAVILSGIKAKSDIYILI